MTAKTDPLKDKLDTLALAILDASMTDDGKIVDALPLSTLKAMDIIKTCGGWYAVKNKVNPDLGEKEGDGIHGFQSRLNGAGPSGERGDAATGADTAERTEPVRVDAAVPAHPPAPERGKAATNLQRQSRPSPKRGQSSGAGDDDNGGAELKRFVASLPTHDGGVSHGKHGAGSPVHAAGSGSDVGRSDMAGDAKSDLDELISDDGV